jgi:hypothetical protein
LDEITAGPKFVSLTDFIEQFDWEYADLVQIAAWHRYRLPEDLLSA